MIQEMAGHTGFIFAWAASEVCVLRQESINSAREDHNKSLVRLMNEGESKQMLDEYKRATLQLLQLKDDLPTTAEVLEP